MTRNRVTESDLKKKSSILRGYRKLKSVKDPRFGQSEIYQSSSGSNKRLIVTKQNFQSKKEAMAAIDYIKDLQKLRHPNILQLRDWSCEDNSGLCNTSYLVKTYYDYPHADLAYLSGMGRSGDPNKQLTGSQLNHVMYQQLDALNYMDNNGYNHGQIRPEFITYSKSSNTSQLIPRVSTKSPSYW